MMIFGVNMNLGEELDILKNRYKVEIFFITSGTFAPEIKIIFNRNLPLSEHVYTFKESMTNLNDHPEIAFRHISDLVITLNKSYRKKKLERICQS